MLILHKANNYKCMVPKTVTNFICFLTDKREYYNEKVVNMARSSEV